MLLKRNSFVCRGLTVNVFPNNICIKVETKMKIRKYFELNENKSSAFQTLWGAAKVSRVKCIAFKFSLEKMKDLRSVNSASTLGDW